MTFIFGIILGAVIPTLILIIFVGSRPEGKQWDLTEESETLKSKNRFKIGNWYFSPKKLGSNDNDWVINIKGIDGYKVWFYGLTWYGWKDNDWISIDNARDFRPATREEVSNVLKTHKKN